MFYKIGDIFEETDGKCYYILAQIDDLPHVLLINLENGNRWNHLIKVRNINRITDKEFQRISKPWRFRKVHKRIVLKAR